MSFETPETAQCLCWIKGMSFFMCLGLHPSIKEVAVQRWLGVIEIPSKESQVTRMKPFNVAPGLPPQKTISTPRSAANDIVRCTYPRKRISCYDLDSAFFADVLRRQVSGNSWTTSWYLLQIARSCWLLSFYASPCLACHAANLHKSSAALRDGLVVMPCHQSHQACRQLDEHWQLSQPQRTWWGHAPQGSCAWLEAFWHIFVKSKWKMESHKTSQGSKQPYRGRGKAEIVERITVLCWLRPRVFAKQMEIPVCNTAKAISYIMLMDVICNLCDGDSNSRWSCFSGRILTAG